MIDSTVLRATLSVPLDGFTMHLRPSELESVAGDPATILEALRGLKANDRAPAWELAVRHLGRHKDLAQAAGEIGMDLPHARDLLEALFGFTAVVSNSEQTL